MEKLEEKLGYTFANRSLLETALSHSSYANENRERAPESNERLEFLGDSVLGMVTADYLYRTYPGLPEGDLTRARAALVCEGSLAKTAAEISLGDYLRLGRGEDAGGGRTRTSILADAVEAVIAAIYLDGGVGSARRFITRYVLSRDNGQKSVRDYKTALQEFAQRKSGRVILYRLVGESGPDHDKTFRMEVTLNGESIGVGEGRTKKEAEQMAARAALEKQKE